MNRGDLLAKLRPDRRPSRPPQSAQRSAEPAPSAARSALSQRRDELAREFVELQWDLGGMAYEMASRDHFRLDVLQRHAARLQGVDGELSEVERQLKLGDAGAAGTCPSCGALHARGAVYCWQCGTDLMEEQTIAMPPVQSAPQPSPAQLSSAPAAPAADPTPAPQPYEPADTGPPAPDPVAMPAQGVPAQPPAPARTPVPEEQRGR